jgi:hypothetical protein
MKRIVLILVVTVWLSVSLGCNVSREISMQGRTFPTSYTVGSDYELLAPLFLFKVPSTPKSEMRLQAPGNNQKGPDTIMEFEQGDRKKWPDLHGVVREKARIRVTRFALIREAGFGDVLYVLCEIMDGPFKGYEVDLSFASKSHVDPRTSILIPNPDPAVLRVR